MKSHLSVLNKITILFLLNLTTLFFSCRESIVLPTDDSSNCETYDLVARRDREIPDGEMSAYFRGVFERYPEVQAIYRSEHDYYFGITVLPPSHSSTLTACECSTGDDDKYYAEILQPSDWDISPAKKDTQLFKTRSALCFWCRIKAKRCSSFE